MFVTDPLAAPELDPDPRAELAGLVSRRMLEPARAAGFELATIEPTAAPSDRQVCWTDFEAWLFVASADDPTSRGYEGKIPVTREVSERLSRLDAAGVEPDLVWLARELPATWLDDDEIPDLVPAPAHLRQMDEALLAPVRGAKKLAGLIQIAVTELPLGFIALVDGMTTPAGAYIGLDPVVLGGVCHPTLPVVQWAVLAQWTWR